MLRFNVQFREHLTRRRENRIAVVTHGGVLRKLLGLGVGRFSFFILLGVHVPLSHVPLPSVLVHMQGTASSGS